MDETQSAKDKERRDICRGIVCRNLCLGLALAQMGVAAFPSGGAGCIPKRGKKVRGTISMFRKNKILVCGGRKDGSGSIRERENKGKSKAMSN